jgi:hypothetical protein
MHSVRYFLPDFNKNCIISPNGISTAQYLLALKSGIKFYEKFSGSSGVICGQMGGPTERHRRTFSEFSL